MTEEQKKEIKFNFKLGLSLAPFGYGLGTFLLAYAGYGLVNGGTSIGTLGIGALGGWIITGLTKQIVKDVKAYRQMKKEEQGEQQIEEDDFSQSKEKQQDPRFQGQEHPTKIERQVQEQSNDRSQNDSREP